MDRAGQVQLAACYHRHLRRRYLAGGDQDGQRQRQIVGSAHLAHPGGRQIDQHPVAGKLKTTVADCHAHPLARLPYRVIRQSDDVDARYSAAQVHLNRHQVTIHPEWGMPKDQ